MRRTLLILPLLALATSLPAATPKKAASLKTTSGKAATKPATAKVATGPRIAIGPDIAKAIADLTRSTENRLRDRYRHPAQTLSFFGVKPGMTVVEILPGGGWYTEILAPYLAADGHYIGAMPDGKATEKFQALLATDATRYGKVTTAGFNAGQPSTLAPEGTADMVLTFRNIHNLLGSAEQAGDGNAPQAFADWYRALRPGGVLGIVEHRLPEGMDVAREKTTGYVKRSTVIRLAMAAGFQFAGASEINANPRDDHDHPKGVWTLPPSYDLGDVDKAKYAAIGESDRMTLKFVKPDPNAVAEPPAGQPEQTERPEAKEPAEATDPPSPK